MGIDVKETVREDDNGNEKIFFSMKPRQAYNDGKITMRGLESPDTFVRSPKI